MKSAYLRWTLVSVFSPLIILSAADQPLTQRTIDFTQSHNLKAIFDAGLRPWRMLGLESAACELGNEDLKILLPDKCTINLVINRAQIEVLAGNELSSVDLFTNLTPAADAAQQAKSLCQALGIASQGLDDFINGRSNRIDTFWGGDVTKGGVQVHITYDVASRYQNGYAEIFLTLIWPIPDEQMKFLTEPIKPPRGYENVSMDPPPINPNQKPIPDPNNPVTRQFLAQRGNTSGTGPIASSDTPLTSASTGTTPTQKATSAPLPSQTEPKAAQTSSLTTSWFSPWYGLVAILVVILTIYVCKRK